MTSNDRSVDELCNFREPLLKWWYTSRRPHGYPWRLERDPYRVLVAEILLQRTRRDKVVEVYEIFVKRFPTLRALAEADADEVKELIKPLGLKKRAAYIVRLAEALLRKPVIATEGRFEELPGVGPYIASATRLILGIDSELVPDTSIARVFSRLFGRPLDKRRPAFTKWVRNLLNRCAPRDPVKKKDYFLALVDLAWEICKPVRPECDKCPLRGLCSFARTKQVPESVEKHRSSPSRR